MPIGKPPPPALAERLRSFRERWGQALLIAVVVHVLIGGAVYVLYRLSLPPPPGYVIVDLLPPRATPSPSAAPVGE